MSDIKVNSCCSAPVNGDMKDYWDSTFEGEGIHNWTELDTPFVLNWIDNLNLDKNSLIFCAGIGDSLLVDKLLEKGYNNIVANDISSIALDKIKARVRSKGVTYLNEDLLKPDQITKYYGKVDLYIDRATLHFFTKCADKDFYFKQLGNLTKEKSFTIIGVFNKNNEPKCCGLDLQLYSNESLKNRLNSFSIIDEEENEFIENNGKVRNYLYLLANKN